MRILIIGMPESIHTLRWISQINDTDWDIYLFPVYHTKPHRDLKQVTYIGTNPLKPAYLEKSVRYKKWASLYFIFDFLKKQFRKTETTFKEEALAKTIKRYQPDIVHSLEFQHAGYMTMRARKMISGYFPKWIATNWGSDIFLFGKLKEHIPLINEIMLNCDYYSAECQRDVQLAQDIGLKGKALPVIPNAGGIEQEKCSQLREPGPVSSRRTIVIKGYQHWAGRALVALQALRFCKDYLKDYSIAVYSATDDVKIAVQLLASETGLNVEIIPPTDHEEILKLFGKSRIYIGLSISDGISTSMLEAMTMGAFPIQSCTACADEWINNEKSGLIVPPEDPRIIAEAIKKAVISDELVDNADLINSQTVNQRLNSEDIQKKVIRMYEEIFSDIKRK